MDFFEEPAAVAIFAASLAYVGSTFIYIINQRALNSKEDKRLKQELELRAEEREWEREQARRAEQLAERERVRDIYHQCILQLSALISSLNSSAYGPAPKLLDIHEGLSILALHVGKKNNPVGKKFMVTLESFPGNFNKIDAASNMLELVKQLAFLDEVMISNLN